MSVFDFQASPLQHIEQVLYDEQAIANRLDQLGRQITEDYRGKELMVLFVLNGGVVFLADLLRRIPLSLRVESIRAKSYHGGMQSSGTVDIELSGLSDLSDQHVLLLDDILDTGRTLAAIRRRVEESIAPKSIRSCVLLDKKVARAVDQEAEYVGFEVGDHFVVGYGLDYDGQYRNLPMIGTLRREIVTKRTQRA